MTRELVAIMAIASSDPAAGRGENLPLGDLLTRRCRALRMVRGVSCNDGQATSGSFCHSE